MVKSRSSEKNDPAAPALLGCGLDDFAAAKLARLDATALRRTLTETHRDDGLWVIRDKQRMLSFSCNDYLNLTHHPAVIEAAIAAVRAYGAGAGASRLVTGNNSLFAELESRLARLKGTAAACVFGSGYLANTGIIPALVGGNDLVLVDKLAHACIWDGARLSGANVVAFRHNDMNHLRALLDEQRSRHTRVLIATDGVFSMDGDLAPLAEIAALAQRFDAWTLVDDAHGLGVVGEGRGSSFTESGKVEIALQMGTLSKAVGSYGAYVCASQPVIDLLHTRARTLIYSTGLPPAAVGAAIAAVDIIASDRALTARPLMKARLLTRALGLPDAASAIVPIVLGDAKKTLEASALLAAEGFLVAAIRPPTVPVRTARLRLAFTAAHPDEEILRLADIIRSRILRS